ncbi:MAG TPA: peptidylprolyl isomerase [Candidatus Saccharimonadales bacterium]|nr:peptidylprolyl isomerase [Candidatus Saccharimonadales bacterium]
MSALLIAAAFIAAVSITGIVAEEKMAWKSQPGTYAVFDTSEGQIVAQLFAKDAPKTVENFVGLAEGTKEFKDPQAGSMAKRPFYDGTICHRIIPGFMMQCGDPTGTGTGGPGYTIPDEYAQQEKKFDVPGRLAMARTSAPNSGGSQFFITEKPYPSLNNQYTIFGQVVEGQGVVDTICSQVGTPGGKPKHQVTLKKVTIEKVGGEKTGK